MDAKPDTVNVEDATSKTQNPHNMKAHIVSMQEEAQDDGIHIHLTWRSWMVVFVSCFACVSRLRKDSER